jgi:hypothetical protein
MNFNIKLDIVPSHLKNKKFDAVFSSPNHKPLIIPFGSKPYHDYTQHGDIFRRTNYLNRHRKREDWTTPFTKGSLSARILWGPFPNLDKNIKQFKKDFELR